jgi:hypothetical protein
MATQIEHSESVPVPVIYSMAIQIAVSDARGGSFSAFKFVGDEWYWVRLEYRNGAREEHHDPQQLLSLLSFISLPVVRRAGPAAFRNAFRRLEVTVLSSSSSSVEKEI